jgi:hypothetical protein
MPVIQGLATVVLLVAAVPFWTLPTPPAIKKIPVEDRCALVSKVMNFRVEIHPNVFRMSAAQDGPTQRLAYWHGKPLVCAMVRMRNQRGQFPIFSPNETCDADFSLDGAAAAGALDRPIGCVLVEIQPDKADRFRFVATITVHKAPAPNLPSGAGVGVGVAPIEGIARRKGNTWELKQLFKPQPSGL